MSRGGFGMITNESNTLESIYEKLKSMSEEELEVVKMYISNHLGNKLRGNKLKEQVKILTEKGYSVRQISEILNCSTSAVSNKRKEIKAEVVEDDDEYIDF